MEWQRSASAVRRDLDEGAVLMDLEGDRLMTLNRTGVVLWDALAEPAGAGALAGVLTARFAVDEATAVADVDRFLTSLRARGLAAPVR